MKIWIFILRSFRFNNSEHWKCIFTKTTYLYIQARFHSIFRSPSTFAVNFRSFAGNPYCKRTAQSHLQIYLYLLTCYLGAFQDQGSIFLKRFILKIRMCIKKFYTLFRMHFILKLFKKKFYQLYLHYIILKLWHMTTYTNIKKKVKLTLLCCTLARR